MAYGNVSVDIIQSSTTGTPTQFNDGSGNQIGTLCRAWVNFLGGSTPTISSSFNVSSVTYSTTGTWVVNFSNAFSDTNFIGIGNAYYATYSSAYGADVVNTRPINTSSSQVVDYNGGSARNLSGGNIQVAFFR